MTNINPSAKASSICDNEIAHFSSLAEDWWNPTGQFASLHKLNPLRETYVLQQVEAAFGNKSLKRNTEKPMRGLQVLDIGCGGGLLAEAMALQGAEVSAVDASASTIEVAQKHSLDSGLSISYSVSSVEEVAKMQHRFDVITAFEIIEHVADRKSFLKNIETLLKPNGLLVMATVNQTIKSYLLGIGVAEYVLGWIPKGTHDWDQFVRPSVLTQNLSVAGLETTDLTGVVFNPLKGGFVMKKHKLDVNYMLAARKAPKLKLTHICEEMINGAAQALRLP